MQFYLAAPFLIALRPKLAALVCAAALAIGALSERPWGGFWWTFRLDGFAVGVLLSLGLTRRWPLPRFGKAIAAFWLVACVNSRASFWGFGLRIRNHHGRDNIWTCRRLGHPTKT